MLSILAASAETEPNNLRPKLLPALGAWRGAELGGQFGSDADTKLAAYHTHYSATPLLVYRTFDTTIGPRVRAWVGAGGILWYNIKTSKEMSWAAAADGKFDEEAKGWIAEVSSLAPAQVFVALYHDPDHNVCFSAPCPGGGVPGNTPDSYRKMWQRIRSLFDSANVTNAVWVMDYSVQMSNFPADVQKPCVEASCPPAAAVAPLWPGDDHVDWVFFNVFEKGKRAGVKATFDEMINGSSRVLDAISTSFVHCNCVPDRDAGCHGCDLASKPWGVGAFGAHGFEVMAPGKSDKPVTPAEHAQFLRDARTGLVRYPKLRAWLYFDSKDCAIELNASSRYAAVQRAFGDYLADEAFATNDAGAPNASAAAAGHVQPRGENDTGPRATGTTVFDVTAYGAIGDGRTDDTSSITKTLAAAAAASPSIVHFPSGLTFLTGPLNLSSSMTLRVDGTIRGISGNNTEHGAAYIRDGGWPQIAPLPSYGNSRDGPYLQYQALIYAKDAHDIAIMGSGTIDGQGDWWWANQRNRTAVVGPAGLDPESGTRTR